MSLKRSEGLTTEEILKTAHAAIDAFLSLGIVGCLFGSVACLCYGTTRVPNDIDIVITSPNPYGGLWEQEDLKDLLVQTDDKFYVVSSKNPFANYRLLYYDLSGTSRVSRDLRRCCKVDVLVPGSMNIPPIPPSSIIWQLEKLPVMPFILLLLMKLQGWMDHGNSAALHIQAKQPIDVRDIRELLALSLVPRTTNQNAWMMMKREGWIPQSFVDEGQMRVREFVRRYPDTEKKWRQIGLGYLPGMFVGTFSCCGLD
ncbi:uncharacterized protein BT62DRAFT_1012449 [Guyanagaster necrorhizus]|uniref:Uncharacterized protein n=1 Tax=Guyanagaster necrorhizus TaxID=856835 RepID=A0A9P8AMA3_9AGAR|nr:uncharacterized protein BT62DRAFT_1012449 [Guyanagaster necrorhizus MCA 3950]KAG7440675.1 hypothetical protein BT62DRAFT_1012449 [Guyanagaster necrorhizus MCA 3950]